MDVGTRTLCASQEKFMSERWKPLKIRSAGFFKVMFPMGLPFLGLLLILRKNGLATQVKRSLNPIHFQRNRLRKAFLQ
jgi:hypothetical protein